MKQTKINKIVSGLSDRLFRRYIELCMSSDEEGLLPDDLSKFLMGEILALGLKGLIIQEDDKFKIIKMINDDPAQ